MARLKLILATMVLGTIGFFAKQIPLPAHTIVLFRSGLAAAVIGVYFLLTRQKVRLPGTKRELCLLLLSGFCIAMNFLFLFEAYNWVPYSVATLCDYFAPVMVMILTPVIFREKLSVRQVVCFVMCTIGLLLLIGIGGTEGEISTRGVIIGLTGMLFYVPVLMINKAIQDVGALERSFLQFSVAAVVLGVLLPFGELPDFSNMQTISWLYLCVIGIVHTGIAFCLYFSALPKLSGQEGALLSYIDPFVAVLVSVFILQEPISGMQVVGGVLLLGFTLISGNKLKFSEAKY